MNPAENYALRMVPQGRGHALYDPYPGQHVDIATSAMVRNPRVEIGDVGYISPRGSFHLLFNVHLPSSDPRQTHGVPRGFEPLELVQAQLDYRTDPTPQLLHSSSSVATELSVSASAPLIGGASLSWNLEHKDGAALAYFDKHEVWNAQNKEHYKSYFRDNYRSWTEFAHSLSIGLALEDLILVTGCDRTRAWATLCSGSHSAGGHLSLEVQTAIGPAVSLTGSVQWRNVQGVYSLAGPSEQELAASTRHPSPPSGPSSQHLPVSPGLVADQCMFVRGFRGTKLFKGAPLRLKAAAGPSRLPDDDRAGGSGTSAVDTDAHSLVPNSASTSVDHIEELPDSAPSMGFSVLSQALQIVANNCAPIGDDNFLLLHDDDLQSLLPNIEDIVWESSETASRLQTWLSDFLQERLPAHLHVLRLGQDQVGKGDGRYTSVDHLFVTEKGPPRVKELNEHSPLTQTDNQTASLPKGIPLSRALLDHVHHGSVVSLVLGSTDVVVDRVLRLAYRSWKSITDRQASPTFDMYIQAAYMHRNSLPPIPGPYGLPKNAILFSAYDEAGFHETDTIWSRDDDVPERYRWRRWVIMDIVAPYPHLIIPFRDPFVPYSGNAARMEAALNKMDVLPLWFIQANRTVGVPVTAANDIPGLFPQDRLFGRSQAHTIKIKFSWPGYTHCDKQVRLLRAGQARASVTVARLAQLVASSVHKFMGEATASGPTAGSPGLWRIGIQSGQISAQDVILLGIAFVSEGAAVPLLQLRPEFTFAR